MFSEKKIVVVLLNIIFLSATSFIASAQETGADKIVSDKKLFKQSEQLFIKGEYEEARKKLKELIQRDPENFIYNYRLGINYYYTYHQKEAALPYFETAVDHLPKDTVGEIFYYLGDLYQRQGNLKKAINAFTITKRFTTNNKAGKELSKELDARINQCHQGESLAVSSGMEVKIKVENLGENINSKYPDYSPIINKEGNKLIFTSRRSGGKIDLSDEKFVENIYISGKTNNEFGLAKKYFNTEKGDSITDKHIAVVNFTNDEQELIIYRDNNIWFSKVGGNKENLVKLNENINNSNSYQPHASLSADGKTLYFSSDRDNGKGGLDIFKSSLQSDGSWGMAENIGNEINTMYDEDSPYISEDGTTLYFSSKGHNTIGGYDIFYSKNINGQWTKPLNMKMPVNSTADDIYYIPTKDGKHAYFASARPGGFGDMDIYRLSYLSLPEFTDCKIVKSDKNDSRQLNYLAFSIPETVFAGEEIVLDASISKIKDAKIVEAYWRFDDKVKTRGLKTSYTFEKAGTYEVKMELEALHETKRTTDNYCISKKVNVINKKPESLANIFYDFNRNHLTREAKGVLDKNIAILKANPGINIKIIAHTDSKGTAEYNIRLSDKRAKAAAAYLIKNGINAGRIVEIAGKGESNLINKCDDSVDCTPEEHLINRRAEFIVAESNK